MFSRLFQFPYRVRCIIYCWFQRLFYFCDMFSMYFESIFLLNIFMYHFICKPWFRLILFLSLCNFSNGILPSPSPNSTFAVIWVSGVLGDRSTIVSTCVGTEPEYYMAKVIGQNYPHLLPKSIAIFQFTPPDDFYPILAVFTPFLDAQPQPYTLAKLLLILFRH